MSGTGASNLGYGQVAPLSNINGKFVNVDNSHSAGGFGKHTNSRSSRFSRSKK